MFLENGSRVTQNQIETIIIYWVIIYFNISYDWFITFFVLFFEIVIWRNFL